MTEEKLEDHASHVPLPPDNVDEDEQLKDDTHKITQEQVEESVVEKAEQEEIKPLEEIHNEEVQQQFVHESVNPEEHDESKTEEVQQEEAKPEISNNEETPSGEAKQDEIVHQEQQTEEPQNEEPSQMEPQTEELKSEESKPEEDKPVEVKTEESKPEEVKHVEIKHEEPKKENEHRPVTHVHHIEKTGINNLLSPQSSSPRHKIIAPVTPLSHVQLNDQSEHHQAVSQTATTTTPTTSQSPTEIHSTKPVGMSSILVGEEKKHVKKIMAAPKIKKINALDRMLNTDTNNASQSSQGATVNTNKVSTSSNVVTTSSNVTQQTNINSNNSNSGTNNSSTTATAHTVQQNVGSTPEVKKRVVTAPAAVSRKIQTPKLPDWQVKLATTFLMTTDMSCTLDDVDMSNSENHGGPGPDIDQITEDTTRCVCNSTHESDVMIQCDCCKKWLHEDCVKLLNSREVDPFICIFCQAEMSKAVKEYIRKKLNAFAPIIQRCQNELQYDIRQTQPIWGEIMEIVRDSQEVLRMIPLFLPTSDRSEDQSDLYK
ncbi:hypothetical protein TRFO_24940 [Tritrichomonas foetus]|uniref:PHD-type domain-containing protein n=1 Tax=Tritrichomonas foetus TaxID=1144522 RepID=A0A1J4KB38_9EUKA|nr:hypothetical protein TRFO_24940 [Tritrichomonas foetus]|eukprot:OHT06908.1 hypothetical protein TRFO_24940 [Tritrichomonas foetus]